ncbi:MAG: FAD-dependent thymidylate synthase [Alphaproteobacteria bacterium]|nr:FAD-dependent thymidylate synthase [Alphaproteobacteria bacterium]
MSEPDPSSTELEDLLAAPPVPTRRPTVPALEERLFRVHPVLDHGFVRVIDYMGDDAAIVQAARVSYGRGTRNTRDDRGLVRYLMRHRHTTPFEMCELKLHVKLPIFVARQWIRHRTANVNEYSARYSILDREFYLPRPEDLAIQSASNRQGRGDTLDAERAAEVLALLRRDAMQVYDTYERLLNDRGDGEPVDDGAPQVARELARMDLTLNYYTQWYWKVDLHNLLHFLSLRMDPHAQLEIRVYGDIIGELVKAWVPMAWEAFEDYRLGAVTLSRAELDLVRQLIAGADADAILPGSGLSLRERRDLRAVLGLPARGGDRGDHR